VRELVDYQAARQQLPEARQRLAYEQQQLARLQAERSSAQRAAGSARGPDPLRAQQETVAEAQEQLDKLDAQVAAIERDPQRAALAGEHPAIGADVLAETARLHAGDEENRRLWKSFLPACQQDIERIYRRLGVTFDVTLGESFYQDRLAPLVDDLVRRGIAAESDGATCIFLAGFDHPMLVRKRDGAFLYATTDLATIDYRVKTWQPDAMLYVVDARQSSHFAQLFAAARLIGYADVDFRHIAFGTVLGDDGRPFRTRSGDTVGLEGLLDEAERRALQIVSENDDAKPQPELSADERRRVAATVGIAAVKYADLSHNRTSDYVFSYDKMLATRGNTATYMQYAYARVRSIFRTGGVGVEALRRRAADAVRLEHPAERSLALGLLGLEEALAATETDFRPNLLTNYLFDLATRYSSFYQQCDVLRAGSDDVRTSRLLLCDLTARTLRLGMNLLGIDVIEKM
jgi:arginyl-tRNA synthetase